MVLGLFLLSKRACTNAMCRDASSQGVAKVVKNSRKYAFFCIFCGCPCRPQVAQINFEHFCLWPLGGSTKVFGNRFKKTIKQMVFGLFLLQRRAARMLRVELPVPRGMQKVAKNSRKYYVFAISFGPFPAPTWPSAFLSVHHVAPDGLRSNT